jgi:hypothetical protein
MRKKWLSEQQQKQHHAPTAGSQPEYNTQQYTQAYCSMQFPMLMVNTGAKNLEVTIDNLSDPLQGVVRGPNL